ncbi:MULTISPECIES: hypothetical protein [unclassified Lebetimonas]|uniref:hypothetical protein n=1 Tax=unclassified Lebetimonas TaxID=2648158 RepID=UPI0004671BE7|nr:MULTISPECIES: hypothetical protein [unclassified Lebetimonas]
MFLKRFIKKQYISFYFDENYKMLNEIYKNNKLLEENRFEFENKKDLINKMKELSQDIPQTYLSSVIQTINQGVIPTCEKKEFSKFGIETENIKYICINNKFAVYASIFDLMELKRFNLDFIYSIFSLIDYKAAKKTNTLYVIITKEKFYVLIYHKNIPVYSDIYEKIEEMFEENNENTDDEIIEEIDDDDGMVEDLDKIEDIPEVEEKEIKTGIEMDVVNFIKSSLEEYYNNYSEDFIENIVILDSGILNDDVTQIIKDMLLIEAKKENFDILKTINEISRKNV